MGGTGGRLLAPFDRGGHTGDVVVFQQAWFDAALSPAALQGILARRGVARVWELRELGHDYEIDLADMEPAYTGAEGYWTTGSMDWLIYASHESSITIAGEWLIEEVKAIWPGWEQHMYDGWDYSLPPGEPKAWVNAHYNHDYNGH